MSDSSDLSDYNLEKEEINEDNFKNIIEPNIKINYLKFYYALNSKFSNVLYNADEIHVNQFIDMIKHHVIKK